MEKKLKVIRNTLLDLRAAYISLDLGDAEGVRTLLLQSNEIARALVDRIEAGMLPEEFRDREALDYVAAWLEAEPQRIDVASDDNPSATVESPAGWLLRLVNHIRGMK